MKPEIMVVLAIIAGGALGGFVRNWICMRLSGARGIAIVNATGSLALGLLAANAAPGSLIWLFLATGVLGAYTTVSSFALNTVQMWQSGGRARAVANVAGSVMLSVVAVALGFWLGGL